MSVLIHFIIGLEEARKYLATTTNEPDLPPFSKEFEENVAEHDQLLNTFVDKLKDLGEAMDDIIDAGNDFLDSDKSYDEDQNVDIATLQSEIKGIVSGSGWKMWWFMRQTKEYDCFKTDLLAWWS